MVGKIVGIRKAVGEYRNVPKGFHVEIWSEKVGNDVHVWTSEYLSQNSWTVNHPTSEKRLDPTVYDILENALYAGETMSMTAAIKEAVRQIWQEVE